MAKSPEAAEGSSLRIHPSPGSRAALLWWEWGSWSQCTPSRETDKSAHSSPLLSVQPATPENKMVGSAYRVLLSLPNSLKTSPQACSGCVFHQLTIKANCHSSSTRPGYTWGDTPLTAHKLDPLPKDRSELRWAEICQCTELMSSPVLQK